MSADPLVAQLEAEGVEHGIALRLAVNPEVCRRQLEYLDYQDDAEDRATILAQSIEGDWPEPSRHYWERAVQRHCREEGSPPSTAPEAAPEINGSGSDQNAVENLVQALRTIADMPHTDASPTNVSGRPCPACVAWEALKQWSHHESLHDSTVDRVGPENEAG